MILCDLRKQRRIRWPGLKPLNLIFGQALRKQFIWVPSDAHYIKWLRNTSPVPPSVFKSHNVRIRKIHHAGSCGSRSRPPYLGHVSFRLFEKDAPAMHARALRYVGRRAPGRMPTAPYAIVTSTSKAPGNGGSGRQSTRTRARSCGQRRIRRRRTTARRADPR